ncbi:MAG: nuclear transport factor 2 family protein, partial [Spirochaetota bacterium]
DPCSEAAVYTGRDELASFWDRLFSAYPQIHLEIEEIFGFSIHCVIRWRYDCVDISGTGCRLHGVDLFLVRNLLIAEKLSYLKK